MRSALVLLLVALLLGCRGDGGKLSEQVGPETVRTTGAEMGSPVERALYDEARRRLDAAAVGDIAVEVRDDVVVLRGQVTRESHDAALRVLANLGAGVQIQDSLVITR